MADSIRTLSRKIVLFFRQPLSKKILKITGSILKNLFFVFIIFILYLPIIIIAIQSVNSSGQVYEFTGFSLEWWGNLLRWDFDSNLQTAIINSLSIALLATLISTVLGTIFAIGIHSMTKKARQRMIMLNQVPILNADIVTGISLMLVFKLLMVIFPDLFGMTTMLIAHVFFCLPYVVLSIMPKLAELDENLYDAALDLFSKPAAAIVKVIIPAISSGIFTGMLIAFTMSIDDFVISYFTAGEFNNVSIWVYSAIGRRMAYEVYAYNTLLSLVVVLALIGMYIKSSLKKRKMLAKSH